MANYSWLKWEEETDQAYKGFQVYLNMGAKRSAADVAREMKLSKSSVDNWSANFRWRDRVRDFDNHVALAETDGLVNQVAEMRDANIALMDKLRGLLDLRLDDFILARKDPTVGWTQALMAMAKIESNALLLGDRAQASRTSDQVAKVEELVAQLDEKIRGGRE
jgi:hypothetical protein